MNEPIYNPAIPYSGSLNGGLWPGRVIRIQGKTPTTSIGFIMTLSSNGGNIGLYLNPRFPENTVICNSKNQSEWGPERRLGFCPFSMGHGFEILIDCRVNNYKISLNGHPLEYTHRIPLAEINRINIEGNLMVSFINFEGSPSSNEFSPSAPPINLLQSGQMGQPGAVGVTSYASVTPFPALSARQLRKEAKKRRRAVKLGLMAAGVPHVGLASLVMKRAKRRRARRRGDYSSSSSSSS